MRRPFVALAPGELIAADTLSLTLDLIITTPWRRESREDSCLGYILRWTLRSSSATQISTQALTLATSRSPRKHHRPRAASTGHTVYTTPSPAKMCSNETRVPQRVKGRNVSPVRPQ